MSGQHPRFEVGQRSGKAVRVIEDEEALDACAFREEMALDSGTQRCRVPTGHRRCPADDDARANVETREDGIADAARGVVEVDVNAGGAGRVER